MKKFACIAVAIAAITTSAPAFAEGNADIHAGLAGTCVQGFCTGAELSYGGAVGYDFDVSENIFVGAQLGIDAIKGYDEATYANYSLVGRVGTKFGAESVYALGGYVTQELGGVALVPRMGGASVSDMSTGLTKACL